MHSKIQIFIKTPINCDKTLTLDPNQSETLTLTQLKSSLLSNDQFLSSFYFTLNGKTLDESIPLFQNPQIAPLSTLYLQQRVLGGGGDGGATGAESRDCYLNMYAEKKPDKIDPNEQRLSKWLNCALSFEPLKEPCVIDKLGNIFNKEALVHALLSKNLPKEFSHIRGLKDIINVKLSRVPGAEELGDNVRFQCPITGLEFNGKYRFLALRSCGHVLSLKALKEVKSSSCLVCHEEFSELDKIVLNGNEEEVAVLRERMEVEKMKVKENKAKKGKNGEVAADKEGLDSVKVSGKKRGIVESKGLEKASGRVDGNGLVQNGKGVNANGAVKKFKAIDMAPAHANKEVYASIFTSSRKSDFKETYSCRSLPLGRN
ncbi:replication termination factor 2-like [Mangifera indica]|uniref:replication termination factor 2-like n=1 Tax=Mangifera indica TaxID=29780 RepID=UPI001CFA793C|nr:replication termination factor 2-like [Mangifera indica]